MKVKNTSGIIQRFYSPSKSLSVLPNQIIDLPICPTGFTIIEIPTIKNVIIEEVVRPHVVIENKVDIDKKEEVVEIEIPTPTSKVVEPPKEETPLIKPPVINTTVNTPMPVDNVPLNINDMKRRGRKR
jgi:hypothetical protein